MGRYLLAMATATLLNGCFASPEKQFDYCMFTIASDQYSAEYPAKVERCAKQTYGEEWRTVIDEPGFRQWIQERGRSRPAKGNPAGEPKATPKSQPNGSRPGNP